MNVTLILVSILTIIALLLAFADNFMGSQGEKKIVINNDKVIPVDGDDTLLNHLSANKIFIPSACGGKATCGHCKVRVTEGGGNTLPTEEIFLDKKQKADGIRLACQVKVKDNIKIEIPNELLSVQEYETVVESITDMTHDIKQIRFKLISSKMEFKAGQYAQIKVPGIDVFRAYSIASSPDDSGVVELIIRYVPNGVATSFVHQALEVGDKITLTGPYGDFYLQEDSERDIICIAGGSGKAPIKSILYYMKERGMTRKIKYFFGARTKKDLYLTEELMELSKQFPNFQYYPALSEPLESDNWTGDVGLITDVVDRYSKDLLESEAYLCGSPGMIDACNRVLINNGMQLENIYYDKF